VPPPSRPARKRREGSQQLLQVETIVNDVPCPVAHGRGCDRVIGRDRGLVPGLQLVVVHLARDVLMYILLCERCIEEVSSPDFARNTHTVRAKVDSAQVCIVWC
jgi:hypothetical protein